MAETKSLSNNTSPGRLKKDIVAGKKGKKRKNRRDKTEVLEKEGSRKEYQEFKITLAGDNYTPSRLS